MTQPAFTTTLGHLYAALPALKWLLSLDLDMTEAIHVMRLHRFAIAEAQLFEERQKKLIETYATPADAQPGDEPGKVRFTITKPEDVATFERESAALHDVPVTVPFRPFDLAALPKGAKVSGEMLERLRVDLDGAFALKTTDVAPPKPARKRVI